MSQSPNTVDLVPAFRSRAPWWGGDLQTVRNALVGAVPDISPWPDHPVQFEMADGTGDVLLGRIARPTDDTSAPLVILVHGLTGCEDSAYIRATARAFLEAGYPVLRLNLRGAGPSLALCHEQYYAGRTEDFRTVLRQIPAEWSSRGMVAIGYSLGGNMLLKYLGEEGQATPLRAAAAVSAPIDLSATSERFHRRRNYIYKRYLLDRMKKDAVAARDGLPTRFRDAVLNSRTIVEYDDVYIAPRYGFGTAERYYAECSAVQYMASIRIPTLVIHARNDPWIATAPYEDFRWQENGNLTPLLTDSGGHVGYHCSRDARAWHDRAVLAFLTAVDAGPAAVSPVLTA